MNRIALERPIAFLDLETTGKGTDARIVEIAIVKLLPDGKRDSMRWLVNPVIEIPADASAIHGITNEDVVSCPKFKDVAVDVFQFINGCDLAGYNSNYFDIPILYKEFLIAGIEWRYNEVRMIDVSVIFKRKNSRTLAAAYEFYMGIEMENAHSAVADVNATIDIFLKQTEAHEDLPNTMDELHLYCNYDRPMLDLSGWFGLDQDGDIVFLKGKFRQTKAKLEVDYLKWMLGSPTFSQDVKNVCNSIIATKK
ncbi:MAG: 3'-5' exonuclease [Taibaiella sp.]|jgi:DNA polymerase-3 subunit epsilon